MMARTTPPVVAGSSPGRRRRRRRRAPLLFPLMVVQASMSSSPVCAWTLLGMDRVSENGWMVCVNR